MRFTDLFIKRPVLAFVVSALILLLGLRALATLPVRQFPLLTNTVVTVTTAYPGATAELMQGFITTPLQQAIATADVSVRSAPLTALTEAPHPAGR